jgi:hypothetical protein
MFGIRDLQRFRVLVADQSETALRQAQEQAAMDEHEVYNKAPGLKSSMVMPVLEKMSWSLEGSLESLSLWQIMRDLQLLNTRRRLMEVFGHHPEMNSHDSQTADRTDIIVSDIAARNTPLCDRNALYSCKSNGGVW